MDIILNELMLMFNGFVAEYGIDGTIGIGSGIIICLGIFRMAYKK